MPLSCACIHACVVSMFAYVTEQHTHQDVSVCRRLSLRARASGVCVFFVACVEYPFMTACLLVSQRVCVGLCGTYRCLELRGMCEVCERCWDVPVWPGDSVPSTVWTACAFLVWSVPVSLCVTCSCLRLRMSVHLCMRCACEGSCDMCRLCVGCVGFISAS